MGFEKTTGLTEYDMVVYLTPLGVEKFYTGSFLNDVKYFSINDDDANYLSFSDLTTEYLEDDPHYHFQFNPEAELGYTINLRGSVDQNKIVSNKILLTNIKGVRNALWRNSLSDIFDNHVFVAYKLSDDVDKYFEKPIVLGERNMWKSTLSDDENLENNYLYYESPDVAYYDYIDINEPTIGEVTTSGYVSFPGVNITDADKAYTEVQYFYVVNATNASVHINGITLKGILPVTHKVKNIIINQYYSDEFVEVQYYLEWDALKDGKKYIDAYVSVLVPINIYTKEKKIVYPYEVIKFGVSFHVVAAGSTVAHWHGQTYSQPKKTEGEYNFTVGVLSEIGTTPRTNDFWVDVLTGNADNWIPYDYIAEMKVVTKVKEKNYFPNTYNQPIEDIEEYSTE